MLRDAPFGWYAMGMVSLVGLTIVESGRAPSEASRLVAEALCLVLYAVALTGFCRAFISLPRGRRTFDAVTAAVLAGAILGIVVERLGLWPRAGREVDELLQGALLLVLWARGVAARRQGFAPARYFVLAFWPAAIGIAVADLNRHGIVFAHLPLRRAFDAGVAAQALLFALALADRNRALSALIALDGLTGIANRRSFDAALAQAWQRARRGGSALGALMIDVDHFKRFNDTHGHQAGDDVLREVAKAVQSAVLRPDDVAARYGGEEFAIVLPLAEGEAARVVGERVRQNVRAAAIAYPESPEGIVTVSVGIASVRPAGPDPGVVLASADRALYEAKRQGRDRVVLAPAEPSTPDPAFR